MSSILSVESMKGEVLLSTYERIRKDRERWAFEGLYFNWITAEEEREISVSQLSRVPTEIRLE